jgi:NTE family protein
VLCLSGGGYRAMLFHLGTLWRLNELAYLPNVDRVSSVSGGSITAGVLAKRWSELDFDQGVAGNFKETVAEDLLALANRTIDIWAVLRGLLSFTPIANRVAGAYRRQLFGGRTLQQLPPRPEFVFNSTSLQSGELWRFSKERMADYRVGEVPAPEVELAVAVAASSAFPPFLSPLRLKLAPGVVKPFADEPTPPPLYRPPYTTRVVLSDGGVYDNLGLQQAKGFPEKLVSDGGAKTADEERPSGLWPLQFLRVLKVIDNQVLALRTQELIESYKDAGDPTRGAYWGIRTDIAGYGVETLPAPPERTHELAVTPTRLARLSPERRNRLVNWGYAVCDAAMRAYVLPQPPPGPPSDFPLPDGV